MGIDLATWRARIGLNYCRQSRYACRPLPVQWRAARWGVGEVMNSTPHLLQGCMAVVSLTLILGYKLRRRPIGKCGCGKVCRPKLRGGSVPSAEVRGMADTGIIGVCLLLGVCAVVLALLLMAGDVERNPGPTGKEGSDQLDKVLPTVDDSPLGEDHLSAMLTETMPVARNWKAIGIVLGISYGRLGTIQTDNPGNSSACFLDMLACWLKRSYDVERFGEPTWRAVVKVVAHPAGGDNCALALSIAEKHSAAAPQTTKQTAFREQQYSCASNTASDDVFTSEGASVSPGPSSSTQRERSQRPSFGCGCGNCTFLGYLENGCPNPISTTSSFPYLNASGLTHEQEEELRSRLRVESQEMMFKFQKLLSKVYESMRLQDISVNRLVTHLLSLGALDPVSKDSEKPLLQTFQQELRNAECIEDVLWVIRDYFSFFNYHVIEHIVSGLGTEQDKLELQNYKEEFQQYSKRRIYECPPIYGPMSDAGHALLDLKVDSAYEQFTVKELENFRYRLSKIFCVSSKSVLRLCRVEKGSFQLIFQVPSFVQQEIFPLSSEQESALAAEGVIRLTCGDYQFAAKGHENKSESQDTESVAELSGQLFQAVLTVPDIDADSAIGTCASIITGDRSSCRFSDDDEDPLSRELEELEEFESTLEISSGQLITGNTPELHLAAMRGDLETVRLLTDKEHHNPLQKDEYGDTAVHTAAHGGSLEVLKYFIDDKNCNPACLGHYGGTPLHVATEQDHFDIIKYLVTEQQVEPLCQDDIGWTPLHFSCRRGNLSVVKFLTEEIEKYKPMKELMPSLTTNKNTPLHLAALNGYIDIVRYFISGKNCDPNIPGQHDGTPLHYASQSGHLHIIKYLIGEQGCDPSCLTRDKSTPLHKAAASGHLDIVKFLTLEKHCNPTSRNSSGHTPIHRAAQYGHLEILKFFIADLKCNPNIPGQYGHTPLHSAAGKSQLHIVKYLIDEQGCDPSCLDKYKQTSLHKAAVNGHLDIVKFLTLEKQCNPNQRDIRKNTPLHYAAKYGHLQVVQFFVEELKCPPNIRGHHNATPCQLAAYMGYHNVAQYLQKFKHSTD